MPGWCKGSHEGLKIPWTGRSVRVRVPLPVHENFKIKHFTEKAAVIQAKIRANLEKLGKPTQKEDSMIASIALANHMVLVTRNTKHFEPIQEVSELQIENWFE